MKVLKQIFILITGFIMMVGFQNCAELLNSNVVEFSSTKKLIGSNDCTVFTNDQSNNKSCLEQDFGLLGALYYLEDKTNGSVKADYLYTKYGQPIPFTANAIDSVNVIIENGIKSNSLILMPNIAMPHVYFTEGFKVAENKYLEDFSGKKLIEAFALDLRGNLQLPSNQSPGKFEVALYSDDGSLLDMDLYNNGNMINVVENDGQHAPKIKCGNQFFDLASRGSIPVRFRYYQGPRTQIALTLLMRKVSDTIDSNLAGHTDEKCGAYASDINDMLGRGWFIPDSSAFILPTVSQLSGL